ncbi:MAG TPA: CARDB domain-containing protein [Gaiellaceae bacterium]|nr:CARDB domain-containing protein [Gaiellaceae bacterium]
MRSELRAAATLTAAAVLALAGAAGDATSQDVACGDPIEPGQVACPDLALSLSNTQPVEEDGELLITVRVANLGNASSPATRVVASSTGWEEAEAGVPELPQPGDDPASNQTEVVIRLPIPDDQRGRVSIFSVLVDPDGEISEHDENNNQLRTRAFVGEADTRQADLEVSAPEHQLVGDARVAVTATVTNLGEEESPSTTLVVSGSGWDETSRDVASLGPGDTTRVTVELPIPESARGTTATLGLRATPVPDELDTGNNEVRHQVAVPPVVRRTPDLVLTVTDHALADGDERLELSATVANIGSGDAPQTTLVATAPGWQEASRPVPALAAGAERAVTLALVVPESRRGERSIFVVEVEPVPDEAGTDDNRRFRTIDIPAPAVETVVEDEEGGGGWIVPAIVAAVVLAGLLGLAAWRLARPRRVPRPAHRNGGGRERSGAAVPPPASVPRPSAPQPSTSRTSASVPVGSSTLPPAEPDARTEISSPTPARVVNTGFADAASASPLDPAVALTCGASYLFWLDVGPPVAHSAERTPVDLPWHRLPPTPELTVAIYSLTDGDHGFALEPDGDLGALVVGASGAVEVSSQPGPEGLPVARTRLLFPLTAPSVEADAQLRCSIYCHGTLVQSRLVSARIRRVPVREADPGFESVLDFTLAPTLDPQHLSELPEPTLTLMLNRSAATHDFTFYGAGGFKSQSSFDVLEVQDLITQARGGLRRAAWGDEEDWRDDREYLYLRSDDPNRLRRDLVELAKRGFRFYATIADRLAGDGDAFDLSDRLARPGSIQIASVESPRHVLPAALLYDYLGFDSTQPADAYTLCPRFASALAAGEELEDVACFTGDCESRGSATVVCPSGFWGYRHRLGMPVSVADAPDSPVAITYGDEGPSVVLAGSTDFELLAAHTAAVTKLCPGLLTASTRADTLRLMRQAGVHLLYFYCHGGVQDKVPFLKVGGPDERGITGDLLFSERIRWTSPRPLVFINGCRTTALEPETAIELVGSLVRRAHASGVIGTEITVFEPLARDFAEAYLARFLDGATVGTAVRGARLALLARGNPLGLAYIPFTLESLRLVADAPA